MGELNYKYFMLFLFTNAAFFYYGATVIFYVLISEVCMSKYIFVFFFVD